MGTYIQIAQELPYNLANALMAICQAGKNCFSEEHRLEDTIQKLQEARGSLQMEIERLKIQREHATDSAVEMQRRQARTQLRGGNI